MRLTRTIGSGAESVSSVWERAREHEISFMAAAISFYAFASVFPLSMIALGLASYLGGEAYELRVRSLLESYLSPEGQLVVTEALTSTAGRFGASAFGAAALLWSGSKVFQAVDTSFDRIYRAEDVATLPERAVNAAAVFSAVAAGMTLVVVVHVGAASLEGTVPYVGVVASTALVLGLCALFLPFYYVMPPRAVSLRHPVPGTVVAVVGWHVLQASFGLYSSVAGRYQAYGFLGAVLLFLLWLYFAAVLLLLGAVVNAVNSG